MTPAQEAKEYASQHGFTIESVGRRYKVTCPDGSTFERGGYSSVLREMRIYMSDAGALQEKIRSDIEAVERESGCPCAPVGDGSGVKCPDPVTGRLGCDTTKCDVSKVDVAVPADVVAAIKASHERLAFQRVADVTGADPRFVEQLYNSESAKPMHVVRVAEYGPFAPAMQAALRALSGDQLFAAVNAAGDISLDAIAKAHDMPRREDRETDDAYRGRLLFGCMTANIARSLPIDEFGRIVHQQIINVTNVPKPERKYQFKWKIDPPECANVVHPTNAAWRVYICGSRLFSRANRTEAVKALRRAWNEFRRVGGNPRDWSATITYEV